jgi:hypothetical protein
MLRTATLSDEFSFLMRASSIMRYRQGLAELALFPSNPSYEVTRTSNLLPVTGSRGKVFRNNFLAFLGAAHFNRFNAGHHFELSNPVP